MASSCDLGRAEGGHADERCSRGDRRRTLATRERSLTSGSRKSRTTTSKVPAAGLDASAPPRRRPRPGVTFMPRAARLSADRPANQRLVVDDEDVRHGRVHPSFQQRASCHPAMSD